MALGVGEGDMKSPRYKALKPGERSPAIKRDHIIACCDCGLVHRFRFTVLYTGEKAMRMRTATVKRLAKELKPHVQFQAWRLDRQTANRRRGKAVRESLRRLPR